MKDIFDLKHGIGNEKFFLNQFSKEKRRQKNIVFVNPQLSNKHLYKMFLPVCWFNQIKDSNVATAITNISEFNTESQLFGEGEWKQLTDDMILWATSIVLPFTVQPLVMDLYARIRKINPKADIIYNVDFNFYELSEIHPFRYIFEEQTVIDAVEDNMFHADTILVSSPPLQDYLFRVFEELIETKYAKTIRMSNSESLKIEWFQMFIDKNIVLGNVDYNIQKSISSNEKRPEFFEELSKAANIEIKKVVDKKKATGKVKEGKEYAGKVSNSTKLKKQIKKSSDKKTTTDGAKRKRK